jgi:hypothetical protein
VSQESTTPDLVELGPRQVEATFSVLHQSGRPVGGSSRVQMRLASVAVSAERVLARHTLCTYIDQARADGERLGESRG